MREVKRADSRTVVRRTVWTMVLGVVLIIAGFAVSVPVVNDATARDVEAALLSRPLPGGTERIDSTAQAGKLVGNGNGMQYLGALLIRSGQSLEQLRSYYRAYDDPAVTVISTTGTEISEFHGASGFLDRPGEAGTFVVYAWGHGPGWFYEDFDLRGH
jgi:hypothetical protein